MSQADWTAHSRTFYTASSPAEPSQSPPPPRAGVARSIQVTSIDVTDHRFHTPLQWSQVRPCERETADAVRFMSPPLSTNDRYYRNQGGRGYRPQWGHAAPVVFPRTLALSSPSSCSSQEQRGGEDSIVAGSRPRASLEPLSVPHLVEAEQQPRDAARRSPQGRDSDRRRAYTAHPSVELGHHRESARRGRSVESTQPLVTPGAAGNSEEDHIFRRIGYSLLTEALRLQGESQEWFPQTTGGADCALDYTYLSKPAAAPSPRNPTLATPRGTSFGDIPLYRATIRVRCGIETLAHLLSSGGGAARYIFNNKFHRVVALADGGRGSLQHTAFVTQPPTDVVGFHYMRVVDVQRELAKAGTSPLTRKFNDALASYHKACLDRSAPLEGRSEGAGTRRVVRSRRSPSGKVFVSSSTSVEDPRVPLQWGYTRCRVHLSAIVAFENDDVQGTPSVTVQYLYAQDPRDQRDGVPGPTSGDHSIPTMLALRASHLRSICEQLHKSDFGATGRDTRAKGVRFTISTDAAAGDPITTVVGNSPVSRNRLGATSPRSISYLPYYEVVWQRIREMEKAEGYRRGGRRHSGGASRHPQAVADIAARPTGEKDQKDIYSLSASPEPRRPRGVASPLSPSQPNLQRLTSMAKDGPAVSSLHNGDGGKAQWQDMQLPLHLIHKKALNNVGKRGADVESINIEGCSEIANVNDHENVSIQRTLSLGTPRLAGDAAPLQSPAAGNGVHCGGVNGTTAPAKHRRFTRQEVLSGPVGEQRQARPRTNADSRRSKATTTPSSHARRSRTTPASSAKYEREKPLMQLGHGGVENENPPKLTRRTVTPISTRSSGAHSSGRRARTQAPPTLQQRRDGGIAAGRLRDSEQVARGTPAGNAPAVRVEFISCTGLPEDPRKGKGHSRGKPMRLYLSLLTNPGSFHAKMPTVSYRSAVYFPSGIQGSRDRTSVAEVVVPLDPRGGDVVNVTVVAGDDVENASPQKPLLRMGEVDLYLRNLRANTSQVFRAPLVGRAGTARAKQRGTITCRLTPLHGSGVPSESLLRFEEEGEVRERFLRLLQERCPQELHRLECYVGKARLFDMTGALDHVRALAAMYPGATAAAARESQKSRARKTGKSTAEALLHDTAKPQQFERRPVAKSRTNSNAGNSADREQRYSDDKRSSSPSSAPLYQSVEEHRRAEKLVSAPTKALSHNTAVERLAPPLPPPPCRPDRRKPQGSQSRRSGSARTASAPIGTVRRGTTASRVTVRSPTSTDDEVAHIKLGNIVVEDLCDVSSPEATSWVRPKTESSRYFIEVAPAIDTADAIRMVGRRFLSRPSAPATSDEAFLRVASDTGLTIDMSTAFLHADSEPCLMLDLWSGLPNCRVERVGSCYISLKGAVGVEGGEGEGSRPIAKRVLLVAFAGSENALPCGHLSLTLQQMPKGKTATDPSKTTAVHRGDGELGCDDTPVARQRMTTFLWAFHREELHKLDLYMRRVQRMGGVAAFIRRTSKNAEPAFASCKVRLIRWIPGGTADRTSGQFTYEKPSPRAVTFCLAAGWQHKTVRVPVSPGDRDQSGGVSIIHKRLSFSGLLPQRDEFTISAVTTDASVSANKIGSTHITNVEEVGCVVVPLSVFAVEEKKKRVTLELVRRAGGRGAHFHGAVEVEIDVEGRDFPSRATFMGFSETWRPLAEVRDVLTYQAAEQLHLLHRIVASVPNQDGQQVQRLCETLRDQHGAPASSAANGYRVGVRVLGLRDVCVSEETSLYVKGYFKGESILRTEKVTVKSDDLAEVGVAWKGSAALLGPHTTSTVPGRNGAGPPPVNLNLCTDTVTFKIGKSNFLSSNEALSVVEVALAELDYTTRRLCNVWVPFYGAAETGYVYIGALGVQLSLLPASANLEDLNRSLAVSSGPGQQSGLWPTEFEATQVEELREVTSLLRAHDLPSLRQSHLIYAQLRHHLSTSSENTTLPVLPHALARTQYSSCFHEPCVTLNIRVDGIVLRNAGLLPPAFTGDASTEGLFITALLNGKQVSVCSCATIPPSQVQTASKPAHGLFFQQHDPHYGWLRIDVPVSSVVVPLASGKAPTLELVLQHGAILKPAGRVSSRRRRAQSQQLQGKRTRSRSLDEFRSRSVAAWARSNSDGGAIVRRQSDNVAVGAPSAASTSSVPHKAAAVVLACNTAAGPPVEIGRIVVSLRGLFCAARQADGAVGGVSAIDLPVVASAQAVERRITILERPGFATALCGGPTPIWENREDGETWFVMGDLRLAVDPPREEDAALMRQLSQEIEDHHVDPVAHFPTVVELLLKYGAASRMRYLHHDCYERFSFLSDGSPQHWLKLLKDKLAHLNKTFQESEVTPTTPSSSTSYSRGSEREGSDGYGDADDGMGAERREQQALLRRRKFASATASTAAPNQSISLWTVNSGCVSVPVTRSLSVASCETVSDDDVRVLDDNIPPANPRRALFHENVN